MKPDIFDSYNRPVSNMEKGGGKRIVETGGYIPVRQQVENMIIAGQRLGDYRSEKYDFGEGVEVPDSVTPDPTRSPYFDLADGSRLQNTIGEDFAAAKKRAKVIPPPKAPDTEKSEEK